MPLTTPLQKIDKVKQFGGKYVEIITIGDTYDDANTKAQEYSQKHNATFVHPFNDYAVMCEPPTQ